MTYVSTHRYRMDRKPLNHNHGTDSLDDHRQGNILYTTRYNRRVSQIVEYLVYSQKRRDTIIYRQRSHSNEVRVDGMQITESEIEAWNLKLPRDMTRDRN